MTHVNQTHYYHHLHLSRGSDLLKCYQIPHRGWTVMIRCSLLFESKQGASAMECSPRRNERCHHEKLLHYPHKLPNHFFFFLN